MKEKEILSTTELAKILGISRIAVYKKIKNGKIKAIKVGHDFVINIKDLGNILSKELKEEEKKEIEKAIKKTIAEYGETLRLLGTT